MQNGKFWQSFWISEDWENIERFSKNGSGSSARFFLGVYGY